MSQTLISTASIQFSARRFDNPNNLSLAGLAISEVSEESPQVQSLSRGWGSAETRQAYTSLHTLSSKQTDGTDVCQRSSSSLNSASSESQDDWDYVMDATDDDMESSNFW
jgi:hypothetical protein